MKEIDTLNFELFENRLERSKLNKSEPFSMLELDTVLNSLKMGKCRYPNNYVSELFKKDVIGDDLKISILLMMNRVKKELKIPQCLNRANITILHKKDCKLDLINWRGIFVCSLLRNILMKPIYERTYNIVSSSMTDAQIGARKNKSVQNHLSILNSIISDVKSSKKKKPIDLSIMDFRQMFDAEQLQTVLNTYYEAGVIDDMFALVHEANKSVQFAVKTPTEWTETANIENKIMQGDVLSPLVSSNMVDRNIC